MITLTRYMPTDQVSLKVEVTPSVNQNPSHYDNTEMAIHINYKNYIDGVFDELVSFTLSVEHEITYENIYETYFRDTVEDYLEDLGVDYFARPTVIEAIARGYLGMKDEESGCWSGMLAMSVVVEIDEFDEEVQGLTMDLDQDYYIDNDGDNDDNNGIKDVGEIRAFLEKCGVGFISRVSVSMMMSGCNCAICSETVGGGSSETEIARLPCKHVFHGDCVVKMVAKGGDAHHACPLCRIKLN